MVNDKMVNIMKNEVNRAFMAKKKLYNQPNTKVQATSFMNSICVGSVHGDLKYGGSSDSYNPYPKPM